MQRSGLLRHEGWRLDQQKNGGLPNFKVKFQDGSQMCCTCAVLAVQRDQDRVQQVYAQVILPCNREITAKTVKMALNKSMEDLECKIASQTSYVYNNR